MTVFLGTHWSSIKEVRAPFLFDMDHGIALHAMQRNWGSSPDKGEVSLFFSSCGRNRGYILKLQWGWTFKTRVCSLTSGLLSRYEVYHGILLKAWQGNRDASLSETGDTGSLSSCYRGMGIPINFQDESGMVFF